MALLEVVVLLAIVLGLAYMQVPVILWTLVIAVTLVIATVFGHISYIFLSLCWILFIAAALFANLKKPRQRYFTRPLV